MSETNAETIYLKDYQAPDYWVDETHLDFKLDVEETNVISTLKLRRNDNAPNGIPLFLFGAELELISIQVDDQILNPADYSVADDGLTIHTPPIEPFTLQVETKIYPNKNTALSGLYSSGDILCTQCEAEGFRRITFYPDRPDVMAKFTTKIDADKKSNPILLSNGNCVASGELENDRHWVKWEDPFPKPSYLFALVAGDLGCVKGSYQTLSGRNIDLHIYIEKGKEELCDFAMLSLKNAMRWDEEQYGLEYDLDIFMIVAVSTFNMGAMENKGLNIFNDKYILANSETATDDDYKNIESIVAHEYFHNWTGNRITCRDWFQLCLKEGLTVFRDQQFSADMQSPAVTRIEEVQTLRNHQFPEDDGPLAHPVRPESFIEIDNFYTATVYEKGAEICRMLQTILGKDGFKKGIDLYFERHDGEAATIEVFLAVMAEANKADLSQFSRWYSQAGRPRVTAEFTQDLDSGLSNLKLKQSIPAIDETQTLKPLHIPIKFGLIGEGGDQIRPTNMADTDLIDLTKKEQTFTFEGVSQKVTPSLLQNLSAPVEIEMHFSTEQRAHLMAHDPDPVNRWDSVQKFALDILICNVAEIEKGVSPSIPDSYLDAMRRNMGDPNLEPALLALTLIPPSEVEIGRAMKTIAVEAIHSARTTFLKTLSKELQLEISEIYRRSLSNESYMFNQAAIGKRALKNNTLALSCASCRKTEIDLAVSQYRSSDNMTDTIGAMRAIVLLDCEERDQIFADFESRWHNNPLVMDKWLSIQAGSPREDSLDTVRKLMKHSIFDLKNPNRVRSLIGAFSANNQSQFHHHSGAGHSFFTDVILELDLINPILAARLLSAFSNLQSFDEVRKSSITKQLERVLDSKSLSKNVFEIADKTLRSD